MALRNRAGRETGEQAVVATVEAKLPEQELQVEERLGTVFGAGKVDVVEASALQMLFAQPQRFGLDQGALSDLEDRYGFPFPPGALIRQPLATFAAQKERRKRKTTYAPPSVVSLGPLKGRIKLRCHAGPDAGWAELRQFINAIDRELIVGMYDFSAPHIGDALLSVMSQAGRTFRLVLDKGNHLDHGVKRKDRTDEEHATLFESGMRDRFNYAFAFTDKDGATFFSDYHIKLAVRDRRAFWLSSGSWQSSNQPSLDPLNADKGNAAIDDYNREWHVCGEHEELSRTWAKFLEWDLEVAERPRPEFFAVAELETLEVFVEAAKPGFHYEKFYPPEDFELDANLVMPLLTPDNYIAAVTNLVEGAKDTLLVQNQSLTFLKTQSDQDPRYTAFTELLAEKSHSLRDFRLILRDPREFPGGSIATARATYRDKGLNVDRIKFQVGCHTKGMIVDGETLLVGSHNLTNAGTTTNRDASLIIADVGVADYYRRLFEQDWLGAVSEGPDSKFLFAGPSDLAPPGMVRERLSTMFSWD